MIGKRSEYNSNWEREVQLDNVSLGRARGFAAGVGTIGQGLSLGNRGDHSFFLQTVTQMGCEKQYILLGMASEQRVLSRFGFRCNRENTLNV